MSKHEASPSGHARAPLPVAPLGEEERIACLRLVRTEGVGPVAFRELINLCGGAVEALVRLPDLAWRGGRRVSLQIHPRDKAEAELAAARKIGAVPLFTIEPGYPAAMVHAGVPPPLLYVKGRAELLTRNAIAIVGSRNASAAGRTMAAQLGAGLGAGGMVVVSGLARGIDGAAHAAALETGTVAVLAGGIDHIYPPEHEDLYNRIAVQGCIVSELPPGYRARGNDFPRRNRIISGISLAVVVVEAATRSGSLITARRAAEQGREVFAVPGHPLDPRAEGTNQLLKGGATIATSAADVLEVLDPQMKPAWRVVEEAEPDDGLGIDHPMDVAADGGGAIPSATPEGAHGIVLAALGAAPVSIDALARATGLPVRALQGTLLELTLSERIERHGAQLVSLKPAAD